MSTVAKDNDLFRTTMISSPRHRVLLTEMVADSPNREEIITAVRGFDSFTPDNDPYGEHDFGKVLVGNESYYFKIDYYDLNWDMGADPNGAHCKALTIMNTEEY